MHTVQKQKPLWPSSVVLLYHLATRRHPIYGDPLLMCRILCFLLTTTCVVCHLSGCQTTTSASLPFFRSSDPYAEQRVALVHRAYTDHYKKTGADEALAWLLYNGVRGGMTIKDIEKVIHYAELILKLFYLF